MTARRSFLGLLMSPDQTTPTAPVAEPAAAPDGREPAAAAEPARASSELGTLEDAFRSSPGALKEQRLGQPRTDGAAPGTASPEESARSASADPASKPGDPASLTSQAGDPSRRGAAAKISEQQSEIDRLVSEREAERARAADAEARARSHTEQQAAVRQQVLARIGDDQEFAQLSQKRMRGEVLSYEQDEKLTSMLAWREHAADLWEMTDRAHKTTIASGVVDRVERYGLDKAHAFDAPLPELLDHTVAVTEARVRKETANEIAELKAELRGLRTGKAGGAAPTIGGASSGGGTPMPADGASAEEWFRYGIAQKAAGQARNGSALTRR